MKIRHPKSLRHPVAQDSHGIARKSSAYRYVYTYIYAVYKYIYTYIYAVFINIYTPIFFHAWMNISECVAF